MTYLLEHFNFRLSNVDKRTLLLLLTVLLMALFVLAAGAPCGNPPNG